ncbi:MAG: putative glycosidase [Acidimicrobiaceae bacterium]|nr:MAG: putative glycosidase [Acidimicrobiaceae bacterium]
MKVGATIGALPEALADDIEAARELALDHVRITLSWAAAQPRPGIVDGGVVEAIRSAAQLLRGSGIDVWICLLSPDVPRWFENDGGFTDARHAGHWWPRWVEAASTAFGDDVDGWIPIEAPFAIAERLVPLDPRRHGEVVDTLLVAWRDAWRILHGPSPIATSLDVRTIAIPGDDVEAAEAARRDDHLRWHTWLRALRDGSITIPGRADRELADLAGSCDVLGIATSGGAGLDLEALVQRTAEQGPDRPLAITFRPRGVDVDARAEALGEVMSDARRLTATLPIVGFTTTDLAAQLRLR